MNKPQLYQLDLIVPEKAIGCFEQALDVCSSAVTMSLIEQGKDKGNWKVTAIFEDMPDKGLVSSQIAIAATVMGLPEPDWNIVPVENKNWLKESLQNFPPLDLGKYYVYGSHLTDIEIPSGKIGLKIDAATAFGSGKHATTQGCMQAFQDVLGMKKISAILDMGCGSGILAMAAAKVLPDADIDAVDIDEESVIVTRQNIKENKVERQINVFQSDGFQNVEKKYDLIFANILARPLISMASDIYMHLNKDGVAILSGFLNHQKSWLMKTYEKCGFSCVQHYKVNEWSTVIVRKD